jgi:alkylhydroperoxidase family enzyme
VEIAPEARDHDYILASHSLNPEALAAHLQLYRVVMFGPSRLSRTEREAMAVAVSAANDCHY